MPTNLLDRPTLLDKRQWLLSLGSQLNKEWLLKLIKPDVQDFVLDVGCGTGRYAEIFDCNYFGVDTNRKYIGYAREKHKGTFLTMNATNLAFPDSMFHYIFSVGLLHNMSDKNVANTLREMKRVSRPGGKVVIIEAVYPTNRANIIGYFLLRMDPGRFARNFKDLMRILSAHFSSFDHTLERSFPYEVAIVTCRATD